MALKKKNWKEAIAVLVFRNWITLFGASLTTVSACLIMTVSLMTWVGMTHSPYIGILAYMILPGVFAVGLILIPFGAYLSRRKRNRLALEDGDTPDVYPTLDFNNPNLQSLFLLVAVLTLANIVVLSTATYEGVVYMESTEFCGLACHSVMEPEYTAYLASPHSRVECVECHIGSGASWFVKSKLSGLRQVLAVNMETYSRPIETPIPHLRPSQDTCERCHWPEKSTGDQLRVRTTFSDDEDNTELTTALLMLIGGTNDGADDQQGIHNWHIDPDKHTTYYAADEKREEILFVRVEESDGSVTEYTADGAEIDASMLTEENMRVMDCMDCHNRPSHTFELPNPAVDAAMADGLIAKDLPYIKKVSVEALQAAADSDDGLAHVEDTITSYYEANYPALVSEREADIASAISTTQSIFARNVYPQMNISWGTYPNHLGHTHSTGCFRCHDDSHTSPDGAVISQDCTICHSVLAWDEESPEILSLMGIE